MFLALLTYNALTNYSLTHTIHSILTISYNSSAGSKAKIRAYFDAFIPPVDDRLFDHLFDCLVDSLFGNLFGNLFLSLFLECTFGDPRVNFMYLEHNNN